MIPAPSSLSRRIGLGLLIYVSALSIAVLLHGFFVNEAAERLVWESLLDAELNQFLKRRAANPDYTWTDTETLELHLFPLDAQTGTGLAALAPGLHDEIEIDGRELVAMVRDLASQRVVLALDISDLEKRERELAQIVLISTLGLVLLMALTVAWGVRRLVAPLHRFAEDIRNLSPDQRGQQVALPSGATRELVVIAEALNRYLQTSDEHVERERAFIDSASHELRTPIAVIAGAAALAREVPQLPDAALAQLRRISQTSSGMEQLVTLLLVLAKAPERLSSMNDRVALDQLLPEIVEDHRRLGAHKDLQLSLAPLPRVEIVAPLLIVQAAIGNLLRNAIEHSDRGDISISIQPGPVVLIEDSGHGMTPEEISLLYRKLATGGRRERAGIGLDLIARLCRHLGWTLQFEPGDRNGTRVRLDLSCAALPADA